MALLLWKTWRKSLDDSSYPDAVLVWGAWPLAPLLLSSLGDVPSILSLRGSDVPGFNPRTSGPLWKFLASSIWNRASVVTANSPALAKLAKKTARSIPIEVIPNGVVIPEETTVRDLPVDFMEGRRPFRILSVSRLIPRKRVEWLIEAVSVIPPNLRQILDVIIAGDGPERYRLEAMVQELDLVNRIHFSGVVSNDRLKQLYRDADLYAHTSMAEGLSNALLEAMATGLPIVASRVGGIPEYVGENSTSFLVPPGAPAPLAEALLKLISDPVLRKNMGAAGREKAEREFNDQNAGKELERIFMGLSRRNKVGRRE